MSTSAAVNVVLDPMAPGIGVRLCPGRNLTTGETAFRRTFGAPTSLESDLLTLASAIYCADLAVRRGEREMVTRQVDLHVPVVNRAQFESVRDDLIYALYLVSHDAWRIEFSQAAGDPEAPGDVRAEGTDGSVLLFSGGLDSMAAAVKMGVDGEDVELVAHVTGNQVVTHAQQALFGHLERRFPSQFAYRPFRVGASNRPALGLLFPADREREESQRARSVLFLALAAVTARRTGRERLVFVAENGPMAVHLPLSPARIGAFSTHTAHPEFVQVVASVLSRVLRCRLNIENPFLYLTKGEVVGSIASDRGIVRDSVSCWRASRVSGGLKHCGTCVPCLYRRIALEFAGITPREYKRDLLREDIVTLDASDDGKRNLVDLVDFAWTLKRARSAAELVDRFPGLINTAFDTRKATQMYMRFADEVVGVLGRYPTTAPLMA